MQYLHQAMIYHWQESDFGSMRNIPLYNKWWLIENLHKWTVRGSGGGGVIFPQEKSNFLNSYDQNASDPPKT